MGLLFPCRLPLFQGAAFEYVVPLLALQTLYPDRCDAGKTTGKEQIIKCDIHVLVSCKWMTVSQEFASVPYVLQDIKKKNHLKFLCQFSQSWIYITIYFKISFGDKPTSFFCVSFFISSDDIIQWNDGHELHHREKRHCRWMGIDNVTCTIRKHILPNQTYKSVVICAVLIL